MFSGIGYVGSWGGDGVTREKFGIHLAFDSVSDGVIQFVRSTEQPFCFFEKVVPLKFEKSISNQIKRLKK